MQPKVAKHLHLLKIYFRVWWRLAKLRFIDQIINSRLGGLLFLFGKLIRLVFQTIFLFLLLRQLHSFAGYNFYESLLILFFLNLTSTLTQMFLRGVYLFRNRVLDGSFDFFLLNPLNELFYSLFSYFDFLDAFMLIPSLFFLFWAWSQAHIPFSFLNLCLFVLFLSLAFIFTFSWHLIAISFGILFLEVDNLIMLYRDLEKMGRFPIDIYGQSIRFLLTYFLPIAIMATIPAKALLGRVNLLTTLTLFSLLAALHLFLALKFWRFALRHYSSASS